MRAYRRFVTTLFITLLIFVGINFLLYKCVTEKLFSFQYGGGDLSRLGYILWAKEYRRDHTDLPRRHIEMEQFTDQSVRVLTYGDSFSNGGSGSRNKYYQDYIATLNNCTVVNINPYQELDPMKTIISLYNNGFLDRVKPKYILVSRVERGCVQSFANDTNFTTNISMEKLNSLKRTFQENPDPDAYLKEVKFINIANLRYLVYNFLYHFRDNAFFSSVYQVDLSKPLFSSSSPRKLLFVEDDLSALSQETKENIVKINDTMNRLADLLAKKGIKLYFMPCVGKYTLYSDYIINNRFPKSKFFEELGKLPKKYILIDTKAILSELIRNGEKDVFYADDTHWSWKASQRIFEKVKFP